MGQGWDTVSVNEELKARGAVVQEGFNPPGTAQSSREGIPASGHPPPAMRALPPGKPPPPLFPPPELEGSSATTSSHAEPPLARQPLRVDHTVAMASSAVDHSRSRSPPHMPVVVVTCTGHAIHLYCRPHTTVDEVKAMIEDDAEAIPVADQELVSYGVVLQGAQHLAGLRDGGSHLLLRNLGRMCIKVVDTDGIAGALWLEVSRATTGQEAVTMIRRYWENRGGIPVLKSVDTYLEPDQTLYSAGICHGSTVQYYEESEEDLDEHS